MRDLLRAATLVIVGFVIATGPAWGWRSNLFPEDWTPGFQDSDGRYLHDFSYAGYERGERELPPLLADDGPVVDVTEAPYLADASGTGDSTLAIQHAIDEVGARGGGVVYLPPGTYKVRPQTAEDKAALYLDTSNVVLRGAGPELTFLINTSFAMRSRNVVRMAPPDARGIDYSWTWAMGQPSHALLEDTAELDDSILVDGGEYAVGDWLVLRADPTPEFIADHGMTGVWTEEGLLGVTFYRQVTAVGPEPGRLFLDIPIRYPMLRRDNARVTTTIPHIEHVGIESLSMSMNPINYGEMRDDDWSVPGTGAYEIHNSSLIEVNHVVHGWVRQIRSFRSDRSWGPHILSNGVRLRFARSVTVEDVDIHASQYHGGGGNGVHFAIQGSDLLLRRCQSSYARHNFSFALIVATGNVVTRCRAESARLPVDFHMHLSPVNLIDAMVLDDDSIEATRRDHADHGHGTTQSVIWNTRGETTGWEVDLGLKKLIETSQFGWGYVIGTHGPDNKVRASQNPCCLPTDLIQGAGLGADLEPESLYDEQLRLRIGPDRTRRPSGRSQP